MRHQYTPIFRDVLSSRVWAASPSVRCVWVWMQLNCDPEGYLCATPLGVAIGANVTEEAARDAIDFFESVDPDADADDPNEGRIIKRVPRGWQLLTFVTDRERSKEEATKARKRRYMQRQRQATSDAANDTDRPQVDETGRPVDVPKPKPKPKPKPLPEDGESSPLPPAPLDVVDLPTRVVPLFELPDSWAPSAELRDEATMAGVRDLDARLASLRSGPIGGQRGVLPSKLDDYVRSFFGKWRTWQQTDAAKARTAATGRGPAPATLEPKAKHVRVAAKYGIRLEPLIAAIHERKIVETLGSDAFHEHLERAIALEAQRIQRERAA